MRVRDLTPGDVIFTLGLGSATFIVQAQHPIWPHLQLVVWYLHGSCTYSWDALSAMQELPGSIVPDNGLVHRVEILKQALGIGQ